MISSSPNTSGAQKWLREYLEITGEILNDHLQHVNNGTGIVKLKQSFARYRTEKGYNIPIIPAGYLSLVARWDPIVLAFIKHVIAFNLRCGAAVPPLWKELHAEIVEGTEGHSRTKFEFRDMMLVGLTDHVVRNYGLKEFTNSASTKGQTAVEIVHKELKAAVPVFGNISSSGIAKAVQRRKSKEP